MQKNLNDILPPSRRRGMMDEMGSQPRQSFGDINPPPAPSAPPAFNPPPARPVMSELSARPHRKFPVGTAVIALVVVVLCGLALYLFSKASVNVVPEQNAATLTGSTFLATSSGGDLPFEIVTVEKVGSQNVPSESTETVNQMAQGTITISNAQAVPQALIKDTRFQTPAGLIYHIRTSISVPAAKNGVPGAVTATVFADKAGDSYNIPASTFTVPGLKGSKAFDLVTAKSTDAMTGGFSGTRDTVSQATRDKQNVAIQSALANGMTEALKAKIPEGYTFIQGGSYTTYQAQPDQPGDKGTVMLSEKGTITAVIFPAEAIAKAIAYQVVGTYAGQSVTLADTSKLILKPASTDVPVAGQDFSFSLTGDTSILWKVDTAKIAGAVAGKTRDSAQVVLSGFGEVNKATLVLRPFWASTFPADPAHITVTVAAPSSK